MNPFASSARFLHALAVAAAATLATAASAQVGPAPTAASLNATAGPFDVDTTRVIAPRGFGGGTGRRRCWCSA
jgi:triacylglycerol lipase